MKKYILLLEDNPSMNRHLKELLKEQPELENYEIKGCSRIDLAKKHYKKLKDDIFCIITDLNMDDEWLDDAYLSETNGGMFSGWVWLQHYVYPEKPDMPTIIYSGYISYLKSYLKDYGELDKLNQNNIHQVNKGSGEGDGFKGLFEELKKVIEEVDE